jgi:hypothetical protein
MAADNFPKFFYNKVIEVQSTYPEGSFERMVNPSLVTTIASLESDYGDFKNAPTAKEANNYMGKHAGDLKTEKYIMSKGNPPAPVKVYDSIEDNIIDFFNLINNNKRYIELKEAIVSGTSIENQIQLLQGTYNFVDKEYANKLTNIYKKRVSIINQTENLNNMVNVNKQTSNILGKNKTTSTLNTEGNVDIASPNQNEAIQIPPDTIDEKYKAWQEGYTNGNKFKERLSGEISGMMFGDPEGGLKYPQGTDNDRTFETNRLKGLGIDELYDELQYWNEVGKKTWDIDDETQGMPVKDWFNKMFEKLNIGKDKEEGRNELLKGDNYIPPKP